MAESLGPPAGADALHAKSAPMDAMLDRMKRDRTPSVAGALSSSCSMEITLETMDEPCDRAGRLGMGH
jgi:hypothetical protein